jgi:cell wall-associated NlpC family hydrolase
MRFFLILAAAALTTACASSGATPRPFPRPSSSGSSVDPARDTTPPAAAVPAPAPLAAPGGAAAGYAITGTALSLRGVPYRNGGHDPTGFDCSGFVWYVFGQHGVNVPRTVEAQYRAGSVYAGPPEPGDLVFFSTTTSGASHVGILIGGDEFVHAPSTTGVVRVERLNAPYWSSRYLGARRVN